MTSEELQTTDVAENATAPTAPETAAKAPSPQAASHAQDFSAQPETPAAPHSPAEAAAASDATPAASSADEAEMSFAEMLAEHEEGQGTHTRLSPGQRVSVRIVAITADTVFVSTGSKVDGIVDREELETDGELPFAVGDMVDLYVVTATAQEVKLSKILRGAGSISALEEAKDAGLPVEGKVTGLIKGGYAVDIMKRRAFCPLSQIDLRPLDDPESPVGKTYAFMITRLEKGGRNIVVSRRSVLEREQAENRDALLAEMNEGEVREGTITRLAPFGAFVELAPGVEGLVHLSELSWARIGQADEAVSPGDKVRVKVLSIAKEEKGVRISLSCRQVTDDPWKNVAERLHAGDVTEGKVVRNAPFGSFVEVLPGVEGLIHISELSYEKRIMKPDEVVTPGDVVSVKIKELDADKRRISLSLRDVAGNPWDTVGDMFAVGQDVTGTVEKRAPFGLFITLAPGITGLMPNGVIQASPSKKTLERLSSGEAVAVRITQVDATAKRISLAPAGEEASDAAAVEKDWKKHAPKPAPAPSMGALGLAMQKAMDKRKK
ncbi:30S ribosomal protein S1 [Desulfovibrio sp. OttesenSCG-928-G15]|nr:30S ribosomal protein S1 [Desulfovibrio sp. OttesenSCG-928-G15]